MVEIAVIVHVHALPKAMKLHFANFIIFMAFSSDFHGMLTNPYFIVLAWYDGLFSDLSSQNSP